MAHCDDVLRPFWGSFRAVLMAAAALVTSGCLSLAGRTYVQESPETKHRVDMLEARVTALERTVYPPTMPPPQPGGGFAPDEYLPTVPAHPR